MTGASGGTAVSGTGWISDSARDAWRILKHRKPAMMGIGFIGFLILISVFAQYIAPFRPDDYMDAVTVPPSWEHWFGVDHLGRDIFSRVIYGARISLWIGLLSVGISLTIGTTLGLIAGYFGGFVDNLIMRVMDIMMALPYVLLAILIATILGPSLENGILAIGIVRVPRFARLARASTLSVRTLTYVEASVAIGAPHHRIIFRDVLPNIVGPIVVYSTLSLGEAILSAAVLSFLGLGAQPPVPEWGAMLNEAQKYLINAPFMSIFPGLAIFLTVLSFNLLGDGLRDILDPRVRR
jgi:ABC-type dipeptide/oligopeptide/nickel transport system permease subunit